MLYYLNLNFNFINKIWLFKNIKLKTIKYLKIKISHHVTELYESLKNCIKYNELNWIENAYLDLDAYYYNDDNNQDILSLLLSKITKLLFIYIRGIDKISEFLKHLAKAQFVCHIIVDLMCIDTRKLNSIMFDLTSLLVNNFNNKIIYVKINYNKYNLQLIEQLKINSKLNFYSSVIYHETSENINSLNAIIIIRNCSHVIDKKDILNGSKNNKNEYVQKFDELETIICNNFLL